MYIPGVGSSPEVKDLKTFSSILEAMSDKELDNLEELNATKRTEIAKKAEKTLEEVTRMIFFFKQSLIVATWLTQRKTLGEKLPKTEAELQVLQEKDVKLKAIAMKMYVCLLYLSYMYDVVFH